MMTMYRPRPSTTIANVKATTSLLNTIVHNTDLAQLLSIDHMAIRSHKVSIALHGWRLIQPWHDVIDKCGLRINTHLGLELGNPDSANAVVGSKSDSL